MAQKGLGRMGTALQMLVGTVDSPPCQQFERWVLVPDHTFQFTQTPDPLPDLSILLANAV
jgi:hypothetical protein